MSAKFWFWVAVAAVTIGVMVAQVVGVVVGVGYLIGMGLQTFLEGLAVFARLMP